MQKSISKSIRLTSKTFDYIMQAPGNGFNEKFENIILSAMESERDRVALLQHLDNRIEEKRDQIYKLEASLRSLAPLVQAALGINTSVNAFKEKFKDILED